MDFLLLLAVVTQDYPTFTFQQYDPTVTVEERDLNILRPCYSSEKHNITSCSPVFRFTGVPMVGRVEFAGKKLSSMELGSHLLDPNEVKVSLLTRYGNECRANVWCFRTGELVLTPGRHGVSNTKIRYVDRVNVRVDNAPKPNVDF